MAARKTTKGTPLKLKRKKPLINFQVKPELQAKVQEISEKHGVNVSFILRQRLIELCREYGYSE